MTMPVSPLFMLDKRPFYYDLPTVYATSQDHDASEEGSSHQSSCVLAFPVLYLLLYAYFGTCGLDQGDTKLSHLPQPRAQLALPS